MILEDTTIYGPWPEFADLVATIGMPIIDNLPGIFIACSVLAVIIFTLRKLRK